MVELDHAGTPHERALGIDGGDLHEPLIGVVAKAIAAGELDSLGLLGCGLLRLGDHVDGALAHDDFELAGVLADIEFRADDADFAGADFDDEGALRVAGYVEERLAML